MTSVETPSVPSAPSAPTQVVEEIVTTTPTIKERKKKRFRPNVHWPQKGWKNPDECKQYPPSFKIMEKKVDADGNEVLVPTKEVKVCEGFNIYTVNLHTEKDDKGNPQKRYIWARNGDQAVCAMASNLQLLTAEVTFGKPRGRTKAIDPLFLALFKMIKAGGKTSELEHMLEAHPEYRPHLED